MDDAAMQLHMAKKRHADAEVRMALTRKTYRPVGASAQLSKESKMGSSAARGSTKSWTTTQIKYPSAPSSSGSSLDPADVLSSLTTNRTSSAVQQELKRIEEEFHRRARRGGSWGGAWGVWVLHCTCDMKATTCRSKKVVILILTIDYPLIFEIYHIYPMCFFM